MNAASWVVLGLIAAVFALCLLWGYRRKKAGKGCCGDCRHCGKACANRQENRKK